MEEGIVAKENILWNHTRCHENAEPLPSILPFEVDIISSLCVPVCVRAVCRFLNIYGGCRMGSFKICTDLIDSLLKKSRTGR